MSTYRLFVAIPIPDALIQQLSALQQQLSDAQPIRWSKARQFHLTLQFIGDFPVAEIPTLIDTLNQSMAKQKRFNLAVAGLGVFPNLKRPQVVWVGLENDQPALQDLHQAVLAGTALCHIEAEKRPYKPHLTLGRTAKKASAADYGHIGHVIRQQQVSVGHIANLAVNQVQLIRSQLQRGGSVYSTLAEFSLRD